MHTSHVRSLCFGRSLSFSFGSFGICLSALLLPSVSFAAPAGSAKFEKLALSDSTVKVRIKVPSNGCTLGDWDAISMERSNSDNNRLLLSIEALGAPGIAPVVKEISNFDLTKGFIAPLALPTVSSPTPVALYICKDSGKTGKCRDKETTDINTVLSTYTIPVPKNPIDNRIPEVPKPKKATDKIYYFGYLVLDKGGVYALKRDVDGVGSPAISGELSKLGVKQADSAFGEMKPLDEKMRSEQPQVAEGMLTISLPHMDPAACIPKG